GDLGFEFTKPKTSRFLVITLLLLRDLHANTAVHKAVERTLKNKLRRTKKDHPLELKGSGTALSVKRYFYQQLQGVDFALYTFAVDKTRIHQHLRDAPGRLYNYIARLLLERCPLDEAQQPVSVIVDRSKGSKAQRHFNEYLSIHLQAYLPLHTPLRFDHLPPEKSKGIQAVDIFSWGIFRKYEAQDTLWYDLFREKIAFQEMFPK
ncbi:MAG: DUF3800 domain-containing protein, partial [candidate division WOR-3 bacterium]